MIPYFIVDAGYSINLFLIMTLLLSYKRSRGTLGVVYIVSLFFYITIEIVCRGPKLGIDEDITFVVAGLYEIFVTFIILCVFCGGNIWRNYTFLILDFALVNALTGFLLAFNTNLEAIYDRCIVHEDLAMTEALVMGVVHAISGCIVTVILSKVLKKDYKGNGIIYMIFSLLYVVLGISQLAFKRSAISGAMDESIGIAKVINVIIAVVTFYIFGMIYFKLERKRLEVENSKLEEIIKENYIRYQELVDTNSKLSEVKKHINEYSEQVGKLHMSGYEEEIRKLAQDVNNTSLTGDIVLDSVIRKYYDIARAYGVRCEFILGDLDLNQDKIINIATIMENVMMIAVEVAKDSEEKWIYLSVQKKENMLLVRGDFSKIQGEKLLLGGNVFAKQTNHTTRLKLIKSLCDTMSGVINVANKKSECNINLAFNFR